MSSEQTKNSQRLGQVRQLIKDDKLDDALQLCEQLCHSSPDDVEVQCMAALVHRQLNHHLTVIDFMRKVTVLEPDNEKLWLNYSADLLKVGRIDDAEAALGKISSADHNNPGILLHRSRIHYQKREFEEATDILVNLVSQHKDFATAHMELAYVLLMRGKWRAGWMAYESRYHLPKSRSLLPKFKIPHWDGKKLDKAILLVADQGYGDCFQFCRYIPLVAELCSEVILIRSKPLARLLDSVSGITESYTRWEDVPHAGAYSTLSGLPRLFSTRPDNIPDCHGLLRIDKSIISRWKKKVNKAAAKSRSPVRYVPGRRFVWCT